MRPATVHYPAGARLPRRVIDDFELVWMLEGRARFIADEVMSLVPGQLLLVPSGVPHGFEWDPQRTSRHGYVHFDGELLPDGPIHHPHRCDMTTRDPLGAACSYLLWLAHLPGNSWEQPVADTLRYVLRLFLRGPLPAIEEAISLSPPLRVAIEHVARQWSTLPLRRIESAELASVAAVSRGYLSKLFRHAFGLGPAAALERVRLSRAEAMLERTDLSVDTIGRQCGFADASHFSHRFLAVHRTPPGAYRSLPTAGISVLDQAGTRALVHLVWSEPSIR